MASLLPRLLALRRVCAMSFGGTRTQRSPAAIRARSRWPETWRQSSRAKRRSGVRRRAQAMSRSWPRRSAATVSSATSSPVAAFQGDHGVALLVRVDAEYHHGRPLSDASSEVRDRRWTGLEWGPLARLLSGHAGEPRGRRRGTEANVGQSRRTTATQRVTPPPCRRLPDQVGNPNGPSLTRSNPNARSTIGFVGTPWETGPRFSLQMATLVVTACDSLGRLGPRWAGQSACLIRKRSVVRIHVRPPLICSEIAFPKSSAGRRLQPFCNPNAWEGVEEHGSTWRRG